MYNITLIACVDKNFGIGYKNDLLFNIKEDLAHFKQQTTNKSVVMGRKTWESLPNKPLPNRNNYVITRTNDKTFLGAKRITPENVLHQSYHEEMFIIGGEKIYDLFLPYAKRVLLTHVDRYASNVDTYFPDLSHYNWETKVLNKNELFKIIEYTRKT